MEAGRRLSSGIWAEQQCGVGFRGPLCGACTEGHHAAAATATCEKCDGSEWASWLALGVAIAAAIPVFACLLLHVSVGEDGSLKLASGGSKRSSSEPRWKKYLRAALDELDQENDVKRDGARRSVNARRKKQGPAINYIDNKGRKGKLLHIDAQPGTPRTRGPIFFAKIRDSDFERSVRTTSKASEGESARNETQISWGTKMLHHGNMYG